MWPWLLSHACCLSYVHWTMITSEISSVKLVTFDPNWLHEVSRQCPIFSNEMFLLLPSFMLYTKGTFLPFLPPLPPPRNFSCLAERTSGCSKMHPIPLGLMAEWPRDKWRWTGLLFRVMSSLPEYFPYSEIVIQSEGKKLVRKQVTFPDTLSWL